jgi:hypothetical protein
MSLRTTPHGSLFHRLFRFLFESHLPVALQVFWKVLCLTAATSLIYVATMYESPWAQAAWCLYASFFVLIGRLREVGRRVNLELVPVTLAQAKTFVLEHHRHNRPPVGWKFGVGLANGELRGVAMAGRPVSRRLQEAEPRTVEITRVCTLGDKNANSMLYGAICRMAAAAGYTAAITYTLPDESGASLKASGFVLEGVYGAREGQTWSVPTRARENTTPAGPKLRWRKALRA